LTESKERCAHRSRRSSYCSLHECFCEWPLAYNSCKDYVPKSQLEASQRKESPTALEGPGKSDEPSEFLRPVDYLPRRRRAKGSFYDEIVREFIYSDLKCAEVKQLGRKPLTVLMMLRARFKRREEDIKVLMRNKKVYLERVNDSRISCGATSETENPKPTELGMQKRINKGIVPSFDLVTVLDTAIIKARCPKCQALNRKDAYICQECGQSFYSNEDEYHESFRRMEELEKELNGRK